MNKWVWMLLIVVFALTVDLLLRGNYSILGMLQLIVGCEAREVFTGHKCLFI